MCNTPPDNGPIAYTLRGFVLCDSGYDRWHALRDYIQAYGNRVVSDVPVSPVVKRALSEARECAQHGTRLRLALGVIEEAVTILTEVRQALLSRWPHCWSISGGGLLAVNYDAYPMWLRGFVEAFVG